MDHVVRRPHRLALLQPVEVDLGERRQVAGVEARSGGPGLQRRELADQVPAAGSRGAVAGVGVGQREAGHQVPGGMAADLRGGPLPAADGLSRRRLPVVQPEGTQHAFRIKEEQVAGVPGLVVLERAVQEFHLVERQRGAAARRAIGRVAAGHHGGAEAAWRGAGLRSHSRGHPVGDQGLLGGQGAHADAEHGQCLPPAQTAARLIHLCDPLPVLIPGQIVPSGGAIARPGISVSFRQVLRTHYAGAGRRAGADGGS